MKKNIKDIVSEVIDNFINEEMSVNNELEVAVNTLCDDIITKFNSIDEHSYSRTGVTLSNGTESLVSGCLFNTDLHFMGIDFRCLVKIRIFWDEQTLTEFYQHFDIGSEFDQSHNFFKFTLFCIRGKGLDKQFMFDNVYHEVEHSLQYMKIGDNTTKETYNLALMLMNGQIPNNVQGKIRNAIYNNINVTNLIATVYYFYYPLELDANINGLYGELVENGLNLHETNYWVNKTEAEKNVNDVLNYGENNEIKLIYKLFGFRNLNKFAKYIATQQNYLKHKEMKVMQRATNKLNLKESITFTSWHSRPPYIKGNTFD